MDRLVVDRIIFKNHTPGTQLTLHFSSRTGLVVVVTNRNPDSVVNTNCVVTKNMFLISQILEINAIPDRPSSVSNLTTSRENLAYFFLAAPRKTDSEEENYHDIRALTEEYRFLRDLVLDKGYQGAAEILRSIIPKKKPVKES